MTTPSVKQWLSAIPLLLLIFQAQAASLSTSSVTLVVGSSSSIQVKEIKGTASLSNSNPQCCRCQISNIRFIRHYPDDWFKSGLRQVDAEG